MRNITRVVVVAMAGAALGCGAETSLAAAASPAVLAYVDSAGSRLWTLDSVGRSRAVADANNSFPSNQFITGPTWSPDATRLAFSRTQGVTLVATHGEVRVVGADGRGDHAIADLPFAGITSETAWSPDGRRVAFTLFTPNYASIVGTWSTLGSRWDVYVMNADGSDLRPVAPLHGSSAGQPSWSADGKRLAFVSDTTGVSAVYTVRVGRTADVPVRVSPLRLRATTPAWSPDGKRIAFVGEVPEKILSTGRVWVAGADGANAHPVAASFYSRPVWAPDSRLLAVTDRDGIVVVSADGGEPRRLTTGSDSTPAWSATGDIAFIRHSDRSYPRMTECGIFIVRLDSPARRLSASCDAVEPLVWSR